jgi:hypothetical protein
MKDDRKTNVKISMVQRAIVIDSERIDITPREFAVFVVFKRRRAITRKAIENGELRTALQAVFAQIGMTDDRYAALDGWTGKTAMDRFMQTVSKLNQKLPDTYQIRNVRKDYGKAKYAVGRKEG